MNYLQLVNMVIRESGKELNELNPATWESSAGQRMYPRIKNYVRAAWKALQMERDQWEFNNSEVFTTVWPKLKFQNGGATAPPAPGDVFEVVDKDFSMEVLSVQLEEGAWEDGDAKGQIEFRTLDDSDTRILPGDIFEDPASDAMFEWYDRGSYNFGLSQWDLQEVRWDTFVVNMIDNPPMPCTYIPWENWFYKAHDYAVGGSVAPRYLSQDFEGNVVFYPQTFDPFQVHFVYTAVPQDLVEIEDIPQNLHPTFHEWIGWEALKLLATYDKDTFLFAHAERNAALYRRRAEKNLMPLVSWRGSYFDE